MPNPSLSPAIIEARAVCPNNVFEIETLEIRHPEIYGKYRLQVAFVIDTSSVVGSYSTLIANLKSQLDSINSTLSSAYLSVHYSLVTINGQAWAFENESGFTTYSNFKEKLDLVSIESSTEKIALFGATISGTYYKGALDEVVQNLNWSNSSRTKRKVVLVNDSVSEITKSETIEYPSSFIYNGEAAMGAYGASYSVVNLQHSLVAELNNYTMVTISGFTDPDNNGLFFVYYDANPVDNFAITLGAFLGDPGSYKAPGQTDSGWESGITIVGQPGFRDFTTTSIGSNTTVIAALNAKNISVIQLPSFANTPITQIITGTDGVAIPLAQVDTESEVRTKMIQVLAPIESETLLTESIFLVNDTIPHDLPLDDSISPEIVTFETRGFKLRQVGSGENGLQSLGVTIDDIDRKVSQFVAKAKQYQSPVELIFRVYLSDDLSKPQNNPPTRLFLTNSSKSSEGFSGTCSTIDVVNYPFPNAYYRLEQFPL